MTIRRAWLALGLVATIAVVLSLYYLVHKPVTPVQALAFAQTLANLAVALIVVLIGGGLGRWLLRLWLGEKTGAAPSSARGLLEVMLGWGALGLGLLLLGALRLYYPAVAWVLAAAALVGLRRDIRAWAAGVLDLARSLAPAGRLERLAAAFTLLVLSLSLLRALAPPITWDALVYHLTLPQLYARAHSLQVSTAEFNLFSGMPQLNEMLYTAAGLLRVDVAAGAGAAQVLGWFFGLALCLGLAAGARDLGLPVWLAPAILFSSLSVALELAWAYADVLLMLLALGVFLALREWRRHDNGGRQQAGGRHDNGERQQAGERDAVGERQQVIERQPVVGHDAVGGRDEAGAHSSWRWLVLAGALAGLACGCKYTGIIVPMAGAAVVFLGESLGQPRPWRQRLARALGSAAVFGVAAGAAFAPWLVKNWLLTGSPVYPLLWPAADMDALRQWFYNRPDLAEPLWRAPAIFARATFIGVQGGNEFDATLGPLLLLCAGLLLFSWGRLARARRGDLLPLLGFVAVAYVGWVALVHYSALARQARLFFAFMPALALLGAAGLRGVRELNTPTLRLSLIVNAAFALVLGLSGLELATEFVSENPLPYLAGTQTAADFAAARLGWYAPAMERVNALPAGSRVVFLWEARSLACAAAIRCVPDVVIDRWWHARRTLGAAEQIIAQWRAEGATQVLVYDTGAQFIQASPDNGYAAADWTELETLRGELHSVAAFGDAYTLYALP